MKQVHIKRRASKVLILADGRGLELGWRAAEDFHRAVRSLGEDEKICVQNGTWVYRIGETVIVQSAGVVIFDAPCHAAISVARAVLAKAKEIEEEVKAYQIIEDQAILARTNLGIGLSSNRKINRAAWKRAEDIKFPGAIEPKGIVGSPAVIMHPPPKPELK